MTVVVSDLTVFLGRLVRLDPTAVVRLRPGPAERTVVWARLPWGVLVTRDVAAGDGVVPADATVEAATLLEAQADPGRSPVRCDDRWRWPLPPSAGEVLETIPADRLRQLAAAAAGTVRQVAAGGLAGRAVGSRMVREALLDHAAVVVEAGGAQVTVPQRLVQAVTRMGFVGRSAAEPVLVRRAGGWVGLAARYGTGWLPPSGGLTLRPA